MEVSEGGQGESISVHTYAHTARERERERERGREGGRETHTIQYAYDDGISDHIQYLGYGQHQETPVSKKNS